MWIKSCLIFPGLALVTACGTSRSTRNTTCSKTNAIVDNSVAPGSTPETYDPTAALLLFKATADKVTIESRCNARLVNKILVKQKKTDGSLEEVSAPIDFSRLKLQLESGETNLELHTSAHCFFRVWDPRVEHQVNNNPMIGFQPLKGLLQNMTNRYQLYRSMLTTPQTLVVYLPDRTPVTFKYKLETTTIFEQLFAEVDKLKSPQMEQLVGRELSKASIILDEFVLHECNSSPKIKNRLKDTAARNEVTNSLQLLQYIKNNSTNKSFLEHVRTQTLSAGRHKVCFSQTDMVVAPIQLSEPLNEQQKQVLELVAKTQADSVARYESISEKRSEEKVILQIKEGNSWPALPTPNSLTACAHSEKYPGFSISDPFYQRLEKTYFTKWDYSKVDPLAYFKPLNDIFPNLRVTSEEASLTRSYFEKKFLIEQKCELVGKEYIEETGECGALKLDEVGRCPDTESKAAEKHSIIAKSINIASTSPLYLLQSFREYSSLALTLPITALHDFVSLTCGEDKTKSCSKNPESERLRGILSTLDGTTIKTARGRLINPTVAYDDVAVTELNADHQFICEYRNRTADNDITNTLLNGFADSSLNALLEGIPSGVKTANYRRIAARFLYLKCPALGLQRLYSSERTIFGLLQTLKFADLTIVRTDSSQPSDPTLLNNTQMIQAGQPSRIQFARIFFNETAASESSTEVAARMIGGPHVQISYCEAQSAGFKLIFCEDLAPLVRNEQQDDFRTLAGELQKIPAHLNFITQVPNWLSQKKKEKYSGVAFPAANFSADSARYFMTAGDSGTTLSVFGLFPIMMLSTVEDNPVSGGLAVIPSSGGQKVQSSKGNDCR